MARDLIRIEVGFQGGDAMGVRVPAEDADALVRRLRDREDTVVELEAEEGRYFVVLTRVLYVKQFSREARVGFSTE